MPTYTCPTCNETMERDLVLFIKHTDVHIEDARRALLHKKIHRPNRIKTVFHALALPFVLVASRMAFALHGR